MQSGAGCEIGAGSSCAVGVDAALPPAAGSSPPTGRLRALGWTLFGIDTRSLAAFRVGLALVLLVDLWFRAGGVVAFYTDHGVLPRDQLLQADADYRWHPSLHALSGEAWWQWTLITLAAAAAGMLLVGWRTRVAAVVSWALLTSIQSRNPQVLQGGDVLLRCLLFWGMLLPLGASWSIDRARAPAAEPVPRRVAGVPTAALLLQTCFLYWFAALLKSHAEWRTDFTAVAYALSIDQLATPFGHWLLGFPGLLKDLTRGTLIQEAFGPFLPFVPALLLAPASARLAELGAQWGRLLVVLLFVGFHLGLAATMELGPFPYVCWVAWLPFLPEMFWDGLRERWATPKRRGLQIWYDGDCGFCKGMLRLIETFWLLPPHQVRPCQSDPAMHAMMRAEESWVLIAPDGRRHLRFDAVLEAMRLSPLLRPVSWPLRVPPLRALGNALYRRVAHDRGSAAKWLFFMRERPLRALPGSRLGFAIDALAAVLLWYVLLWNVRTLYANNDEQFQRFAGRWLPSSENWIVQVPRLDQYWSMFAPNPLHEDGWYLAAAKLADGSDVDLLTGLPPNDVQPSHISTLYPDERWRKYLMNLYTSTFATLGDDKNTPAPWRENYARWLMRRWDERHPPERRVVSLELWFWTKANRYGQPPIMSKGLLARLPPRK
jgi:predicted DCC family thiol-disulfide oxidoreductase YuxK